MRTASSSSSAAHDRPRKRKWSRDQLLRNLEILGDLSAPLPPTLPPSPPASRSSSPAPPKRKVDSSADSVHAKRPRTSSFSTHHSSQYPTHPPHHHQQQQQQQRPRLHHPEMPPMHLRPSPAPAPPAPFTSRSEPAEDGEVREEPTAPSSSERGSAVQVGSSLGPSQVPIRRPRKGRSNAILTFDELHTQYHNAGRMLKYSGDQRFWSTFPPGHKEYKSIPDPPPPGSSYHKHGGLIARLELVDALVCFAYSIWTRDYSHRQYYKGTWATIESFLSWCKHKWQSEDADSEAEKAFLGLIYMIEAFIQGRKIHYTVKNNLDPQMDKVYTKTKERVHAAAENAIKDESNGLLGVNAGLLASKTMGTPPMLPSPASIAPVNSANSTPTGRGDGTPNVPNGRLGSAAQPPARPAAQPSGPTLVPPAMVPKCATGPNVSPHVAEAMAAVTEPISPTLVDNLRDITNTITAVGYIMALSQNTLNLPVMAKHFPHTFARMIHSSLGPMEEHEPDINDEEGELFWPGQLMTGEGLGWVCLMGKAMINEFGKAYDYKGVDGVVPKPESAGRGDESSKQQQQQRPPPQRPGSTPQGYQGHSPYGYGSSSSHPQHASSGLLQVPR